MYPFLNTDYNSTTRKDVVFVNMRNPSEGLMRGMIVAFWYARHAIENGDRLREKR